jgi:hypothetical protein
MRQIPRVVRVRRRTGGGLASHIPCGNCIGGCAARPFLRACSEWINPARAHIAHAAAYAKQTKTALGLLRLVSVPYRLKPFLLGHLKNFYIRFIL